MSISVKTCGDDWKKNLSEWILRIIPLGDVDRALVSAIAGEACPLQGFSVILSSALPLDESAYDLRKRQYSSPLILASLRTAEGEGMMNIAVADVDLSYPGLNYVFGLTDDAYPLAVISVARFGGGSGKAPADIKRVTERAVKTVFHELGHLFGLSHCSNDRCVMFLSFNIVDTDLKGKEFCAACKKKLERKLSRRRVQNTDGNIVY